MGVSSVQDGLDATGFATGLAGTAALAGAAGLAGCANPVAGSASTQAIADIANLDDQRRVRSFKKTASAIILAI
jgi:hypothetical protein